jgi:hypothetical protein
MYLLQSEPMTTNGILVILVIALILTLYITYYIIKGAVSAANKKTEKYLRVIINLKSEQLRRSGVNNSEIIALVNSVAD